jgi:hypothetical protein
MTARRRRWSFSLRTLLIGVLVISGGLAWLTNARWRIAQRRQALARCMWISPIADGEPRWRVWLLGEDWPMFIDHLELRGDSLTDKTLIELAGLKNLRSLELSGSSKLTNQGLAKLQQLPALRELNLHDCERIGDPGLKHLAALGKLEALELDFLAITDRGLVELHRNGRLRRLSLIMTKITDGGLAHLRAMPSLEHINARLTRITAKGVRAFRAANNHCELEWTDDGQHRTSFPSR